MITTEEVKNYLGVSDTDSDALITRMIAAAYKELQRATGTDWSQTADEEADECARMIVWLSFWAARGDNGNAAFIRESIDRKITQLQYRAEEEPEEESADGSDEQENPDTGLHSDGAGV